MRKLILSLLVALLSAQYLLGNPATPDPIRMKQPDGSYITLRLHGDEFYSWYTSEDGKTHYVRDDSGWWKPAGAVRHSSSAIRRAKALREERDKDLQTKRVSATRIGWGTPHILVILVQWSDKSFGYGAADYTNRSLNSPGFSDYDSIGSVRDYYEDASNGQFSPIFDVVGPVTVSRGCTEFPENDDSDHREMAKQTLVEALKAVDAMVDFSRYDLNSDGYIDSIYLIYPGYDQANGGGPDTIWPHQSRIADDTLLLDGVKALSYACSSEYRGNSGDQRSGIGTFCHEFGHLLGLPDLYDVDYEENGRADYPYQWNLMASGNHLAGGYVPARLSSYERFLLGYITEFEDLRPGQHTLQSLDANKLYRIPSSRSGEYFIPEVRNGQGWDSYLAAGMIIYHIDCTDRYIRDYTAKQHWQWGYNINAYEDHPLDYLLIPDPYLYIMGYPINDSVYKPSFFNLLTFPTSDYCNYWGAYYYVSSCELRDWDGIVPFHMNGITYDNASGTASFTLSIGDRFIKGKVTDNNGKPISGATLLLYNSESASPNRARLLSLNNLRPIALREVKTSSDGSFSISLDHFIPEQVTLSVFAENYLPQEEKLDAWHSLTRDYSLTPVIQGGTDVLYSKANLPLTAAGAWGHQVGFDYTVAQHYTARELESLVGQDIKAVSFSTSASGEEVWVFIDAGTSKRVRVQRVYNVDTNLYTTLANMVTLEEPYTIPSGTDLYIGYLVKNANDDYIMYTDGGPAAEGGMYMYYGFSTRKAGGVSWVQPSKDWGWSDIGNALVGFTVTSKTYIHEAATLRDLGFAYIEMPEGTLRAGDVLPLKVVTSPSRSYTEIEWKMDGKLVNGDSVTLTAGEHRVEAFLTGEGFNKETVSVQITVL